MTYFEKLLIDLENKKYDSIITPNSFHYIADYVYTTRGNRFVPKNINLLTKDEFHLVEDFNIILIDCKDFNSFTKEKNIIDKINKKIILITASENLPQVLKSDFTDYILNHEKVLLWFSQNPIYPNSNKYFAIPYGIRDTSLNVYSNHLLKRYKKENNISNLPVGIHGHLPKNHIRRVYDELGKDVSNKLEINEFYETVGRSKFVISTSGDRQDCYRHYECIGLGAIPISDVDENYKYIFHKSMVYKNGDEMIRLIETDGRELIYQEPNKDMICRDYHFDIVRDKINNCVISLSGSKSQ